jgi:hypothetical protein
MSWNVVMKATTLGSLCQFWIWDLTKMGDVVKDRQQDL